MNFGDLITYTRQRTGTENNFSIADSEIQTLLNMALGSLYTILTTDYEDYNLSRFLCNVSAAAPTIPLPSDFFKLRGVDFGAPGAWTTLFGFNLQERNRYANPIGNLFAPYGNGARKRVRVMGNQIFISPETLAAGQYQVWYTPKFSPLVNLTDAIPAAIDTDGFVEYAVAATGVKIYNKLNLDSQTFMTEMQLYADQARNGARNRMSQGPKGVVNMSELEDECWPFGRGGGWSV